MINDNMMNVLDNSFRNKVMEQDVIDTVANMINTSGANRAQRRRLEKGLARANKLSEKAQKKLDYSAYNKYKAITDEDFVHFNAVLALVMYEDYRWEEDPDAEHGQITSLMERIQKKMRKLQKDGYSTKDIVNRVYELTGIQLVSDIEASGQKTDT